MSRVFSLARSPACQRCSFAQPLRGDQQPGGQSAGQPPAKDVHRGSLLHHRAGLDARHGAGVLGELISPTVRQLIGRLINGS